MKLKFFIVACLFSSLLFSQLGPGYMGKRCVLGYGFNFSPAVFGPNGQESCLLDVGNAAGGELALNSMHEGFIEYAFKNRTSVGFSAKYFRTSYANQVPLEYYYSGSGYSSGSIGEPSGLYHISGLDYNLYFKFFHRRYVAPWGRYVILGAVFNRYKSVYDPSAMFLVYEDHSTYPPQKKKLSDFGPTEQDYMRGDIRFGWGRSRILLNRITLDYGISFEIVALLGNFLDKADINVDFSFDAIQHTRYIQTTSRRRVREVSSVNVFIKAGVLIF
jgi:hypothetical protein